MTLKRGPKPTSTSVRFRTWRMEIRSRVRGLALYGAEMTGS